MNIKILKTLLFLCIVFYVVGAITHYFGITLFPWFDSSLYSPYHDSIIAMASLAIAGFFFVTFLNPLKNRANLYVIIFASVISGVLTILMANKVDFISEYGSNLKYIQAYTEGVLLIIISALFYFLRPKN